MGKAYRSPCGHVFVPGGVDPSVCAEPDCLVPDDVDAHKECTCESAYHPDPVINAEIAADTLDAEIADIAAGYPPRQWTCPCGATHSRGHHVGTIGVHRCLACGYIGTAGIMHGTSPKAADGLVVPGRARTIARRGQVRARGPR